MLLLWLLLTWCWYRHVVANNNTLSKNYHSGNGGPKAINLNYGCYLRSNSANEIPSISPKYERLSESGDEYIVFDIVDDNARFFVFHVDYFRLEPTATLIFRDYTVISEGEKTNDRAATRSLLQYDSSLVGSKRTFYTAPLYTQHVRIEYYPGNFSHTNTTSEMDTGIFVGDKSSTADSDSCFGFHIDEYRYTVLNDDLHPYSRHSRVPMRDYEVNDTECTSPTDESQPAACLQYNPTIFSASNAVMRLLIQKSYGAIYCTGWLFGCAGHVLTNHHCVSNPSEADATTMEFHAQAASCTLDTETITIASRDVHGTIEATSADLVTISLDSDLDYALLLPRLTPDRLQALVQTYGYLSMRSGDVQLNERVFIPQHPAGEGKRIAVKHDQTFGTVVSLADPGCNALGDSLGYLLDTKGGSSGSPVIASCDGSVIGLHYCGGCRNSAIPAKLIAGSLTQSGQLPSCALSGTY